MLYIYLLVTTLCFVSPKPIDQELVVLKPSFVDKARPVIKRCEDETKSPPDAFKNMLKGNIENDSALKFIYCYLGSFGVIDKEGHFVVDKVVNFLDDNHPKAETARALGNCNKINGMDHLDTLRLMVKCYKDTSPILFVP